MKRLSLKTWLIPLIMVIVIYLFLVFEPKLPFAQQKEKNFPKKIASVEEAEELISKVTLRVLPENGYQSRIALGKSILELTEAEVIDNKKFKEVYKENPVALKQFEEILKEPSLQPIHLTQANASLYLNLLWPLGLASYMEVNEENPLNKSLFNLASTAGWTLGKAGNGGVYFNKFKILSLTKEQEKLVKEVAEATYRPCCNNSTFFADCNHGAALLGLLELGASQGLNKEELFKEALLFNIFWFPSEYIETALYFQVVKQASWESLDPQVLLSQDFSSARGWRENVHKKIQELKLLPLTQMESSCKI